MKYYNIIDYGSIRDSLNIVITITIIYVIIFITGLIGNISTCLVITRKKSMHTATNYYIYSLALSDLLLLISGLAPEIYLILFPNQYVFGYTFCILTGFLTNTSAHASVLTITAFTAEKYVTICQPLFPYSLSKLSRVIKLIILIWVVAICCAIPHVLLLSGMNGDPGSVICLIMKPIMKFSSEISTCVFFLIWMIIITVFYCKIGFRLRLANRMNRIRCDLERTYHSLDSDNPFQPHGKSSQRVVKMLVAVVVTFFICWVSLHTQRLVAIYVFPNDDGNSNSFKIYEVVRYVTRILYFLSAAIHPIFYFSMSDKFRDAFKETFLRCYKSSRPIPDNAIELHPVCLHSTRRFVEYRDFDRSDPNLHAGETIMSRGWRDSIHL